MADPDFTEGAEHRSDAHIVHFQHYVSDLLEAIAIRSSATADQRRAALAALHRHYRPHLTARGPDVSGDPLYSTGTHELIERMDYLFAQLARTVWAAKDPAEAMRALLNGPKKARGRPAAITPAEHHLEMVLLFERYRAARLHPELLPVDARRPPPRTRAEVFQAISEKFHVEPITVETTYKKLWRKQSIRREVLATLGMELIELAPAFVRSGGQKIAD